MALSGDARSAEDRVRALVKTRLTKTSVTAIDGGKVGGLCEITAGENLFYVDSGARYLLIGRVYDIQIRQDITAARLLERTPAMPAASAARANALAIRGVAVRARHLAAPPPRMEGLVASVIAHPLSLSCFPPTAPFTRC